MRMRKLEIVFLFLLAALLMPPDVTGAGSKNVRDWWPDHSPNTARICFERLESNGRVNVLPSRVHFGGSDQTATLGGGDSACLFVAAGEARFFINSDDPYGFLANQRRCHSKKLRVNLPPHQTQRFQSAQLMTIPAICVAGLCSLGARTLRVLRLIQSSAIKSFPIFSGVSVGA